MAACPPRLVEEKGPCKIRTKNQTLSVTGNCNDEECKPSKSDDDEISKTVSCAENKEDGVASDTDLLNTLSFGEFEGLLQEVSTPQFTNKNCAANNPLMKKLIDSKVIDAKCLENDVGVSNWSIKSWAYRSGGNKESRRGFDRKSRLESYGQNCSLDGSGGESAASRTTQGGSLQNLHGKSEGKKSSLHKSGSLNTFPNASSFDSYEELAVVKSVLAASSKATANKSTVNTNQSKRIRSTVSNYGTSTCCPAVTTTKISSNCNAVGVNRTLCGELKETYLGHFSSTECTSSPAVILNKMEHELSVNNVGGVFNDGSSNCSAFAVETETERPTEDKIMMMEVDVGNEGGESEKIPLLKSNTSSITNGNGIDSFQGRMTEITQVDEGVTYSLLPMKVKTKHDGNSGITNLSLCSEDWRTTNSINQLPTCPVLPFMNGRQSFEMLPDKNRKGPPRLCDDNGNPIHHHLSADHYDATSIIRTSSVVANIGSRDTEISGRGTDLANRGKKKSKTNNKEKLLNPTEFDGYFGDLAFEDILKRLNSNEGEESNKLRSAVVDGKNKKSGNKAKKISSHKEIRKNTENEMLRVNGNKDDVKNPSFESSLVNEANTKNGNRFSKKKWSNVVHDEGTSSGSHSPELDADDKEHASMQKNVRSIPYSDGTISNAEDVMINITVQGQHEQVTDNLVSSFVSDFYSATEPQAVVEDSEFHEVKKKKKKKPRPMDLSKSDGGTSANSYRYHRYGGVEEGDGGRNSSSATSWANLSTHRRGLHSSDDIRRKSTSSMPPSDHSSPDNSDVESVHSLPAGSTTLRPTINKTSSSSSCTPQASYADIAKMTTVSVDSSSNYKFSSLSPTTPLCHHSLMNSDVDVDKRKDVATVSVPLESDETCEEEHGEDPCKVKCEIKTVDEAVDEPSVESSLSSSLERENLCDSPPIANPGVEFVSGLELPEDTIEVSFGFEVNEQLLQMTETELMAPIADTNPHHIDNFDLQMQQSRTEPMIIGANVIYSFSKGEHSMSHSQEIVIENQGLIISHVPPSPIPAIATTSLSVQLPQRFESLENANSSVIVNTEPIYAETPTVEHQSIVNYIGLAWLKVSGELERESNDQLTKRVRYFSKE